MSASDLVPRVVLFVTDLERKNAALQLQLQGQESQFKEQEDKQLLVQITGPNRTPIYYEGSLKHGGSGPAGWIHFDNEGNNNDNLLPLSLVIDSEVWLGGILIETFQDVDRFFSWGNVKRIDIYPEKFTDEENAFGTRGRSPVPCVSANIIGPMTDMEFSTLCGGLPLNLKEQLAVHDDLYLKIKYIVFRKKNIRGAMSLLKKLEIFTREDDDVDSDFD
mmetsp:Transcript_29904/g.30419  ORF Transcript_29904/g.30419 Transcript_29904/m.30419 type:complete len:219 (+) Transcript_29904:287-943(+)